MKRLKKNILLIFGTRPEAIKLCPLVKELQRHSEEFSTTVCVTGQHRKMLDQVLKVFDVVPKYDLHLMTDNQTLESLTSACLSKIMEVLKIEKPDLVIVQGDTTTTFTGSLAAFYSKIKVGHVEAGLRTNNRYSPFPEEMNRKMTTCLADYHYAPTLTNKQNLLKEGVSDESIVITGNTVIDALLWVRDKLRKEKPNFAQLKDINFDKKVILVTGHRRENFGEGFQNICAAIKKIAESYNDIEIVYPVHLNPNVRKPVNAILAGISNIKLIDPLEYEPFVYLMDKSYFIISDSGGIQEEAPSLGKPVLVTRNTTERPEAVEAGAIKLVGVDKDDIFNAAKTLLNDSVVYNVMATSKNPYGEGDACEQIVESISKYISIESHHVS